MRMAPDDGGYHQVVRRLEELKERHVQAEEQERVTSNMLLAVKRSYVTGMEILAASISQEVCHIRHPAPRQAPA